MHVCTDKVLSDGTNSLLPYKTEHEMLYNIRKDISKCSGCI